MVHFDHFSAHINACKVLIRLWRNVRVTANQRNRQHFQMFFFSLEEVPAVVFRDFSEKKLFSAYFLMALDGIVRALLITHFFSIGMAKLQNQSAQTTPSTEFFP